MENSKIAKEKNKKVEDGPLDIMATLAQEAEQIIIEASEEAGREAGLELEKVLREYEQRTKQIVLKVREKTKSKTAEIANRLSEAVMLGIEKASAKAVAGVVTELSVKSKEFTKEIQEAAEKEAGQEVVKAAVGLSGVESAANRASEEDTDVADAGTDSAGRETEVITEEEGIELQQPVEVESSEQPVEADNFDQWLTQ